MAAHHDMNGVNLGRPSLLSPTISPLTTYETSTTASSGTTCCPALNDAFGQRQNVSQRAVRKLLVAISLCLFFMITEIIGGYLSGSLAIISDAAHLLSDVAGFLVSLFAITWSHKRANSAMSYGYHRIEILGALLSISLVWTMTFYLMFEAVVRLRNPVPIDGRMMFFVAFLGFLVNIIITLTLHDHHKHKEHHSEALSLLNNGEGAVVNEQTSSEKDLRNINVRAAYIHAVGDLIQSVGVLVAAAIIWIKPEWQKADPVCTFLFSIIVVTSTWFLARDTIIILMEGTPTGLSPRSLQRELTTIDGVLEVHDLHIWSLAPGKVSATVHIVIDWSQQRLEPSFYEAVLVKCQKVICCHDIHHVTIQVDPDRHLDVHCRTDCCGSDENFLSNMPDRPSR